MVEVIALRTFMGDAEGLVKPGRHLDVPDRRAEELVKGGLAMYGVGAKSVAQQPEPEPELEKPEPEPAAKEDEEEDDVRSKKKPKMQPASPKNKMATAPQAKKPDPTTPPRAGSRTGGGKPVRSSLPPDRQRKR